MRHRSAAAVTAAGIAAAASVAAPAQQIAPMGLGGEQAVRAFDDRLDQIAARYDMSAQQLAMLLATDDSARLNRAGELFYVCLRGPDEPFAESVTRTDRDIPLSQAFLLNSDPGASKTIYLDFDGHHSVNNSWGHNIQFPAFDRNGDPGTFSDAELAEIIGHWEQVVEDFAPFDVNITTQDPGLDALRRSGGGDSVYGVRCVHTQATAGFGNGIGGVAYLNSFDDSIDNPVFAFNKGVLNGGMTASHEVGHALGLSHDGLNGSAYHPGSGPSNNKTSWGPIMGAPFGKNVVHWSRGDYAGATTTQDDLAIITKSSNGINYRNDDFAGTIAGASAIVADLPVSALIERNTDADVFRIELQCGTYSFGVTPVNPGPNLDMLLQLLDADGNVLRSDNVDNQVLASINATLPAGTYYLRAEGVAHPVRYSDYGSIGQYTVLATTIDTCSHPCGADLDGNGTLNVDDLDAFVGAFMTGGSVADCDANGMMNVDDVDCYISAFNAGCP